MDKDKKVPWYTVLRRIIPFLLLCILFLVCYFLFWAGYGKKEADRFFEEQMYG